jgi:DNA polymerase-1
MAVYDANTPVRPSPEGVHTDNDGRTFTAGAAYVRDACAALLATGRPLAVDIETVGTGALAYQIKVVTIGTDRDVVALDPRDPDQANLCRWTLHEAKALVFHGGDFDIPPMVHHRLMSLEDIPKVHDTLVYARMAEPDTLKAKDLTACAKRYLGWGGNGEATIKAAFKAAGYRTLGDGYANMDIDAPVYLRSAMMDTAVTAALVPALWQAAFDRLTSGHPFIENGVTGDDAAALVEREQIVNRVMLRRSAIGLPIDLDFLTAYQDKHTATIDAAAAVLSAEGVDPGNGAHLTKRLDADGLLPDNWPRTAKTKAPSAKAKNLETLTGHPLVDAHLKWKELDKITGYLTTCEDMSRIDGRIHPQVKILGASATGRMSYGNPALQQFPGDARGIVVAEDGRGLTSIDWSSIEPIVMANAAGDQPIIDAYENGGDLYAPVVATTGVSRKRSKVVLLGAMYGEGIAALATDLGVDEDEASAIKASVMGAMPGIKRFLFQLKNIGNTHGLIPTISGRILSVPRGVDGKLQGYKAQNYYCQGSAYDVLAETIVECVRQGLGEYIVMALHDELVVESEAALAVRRIMETPPAALLRWAGRQVILRTDMADMGREWASV